LRKRKVVGRGQRGRGLHQQKKITGGKGENSVSVHRKKKKADSSVIAREKKKVSSPAGGEGKKKEGTQNMQMEK